MEILLQESSLNQNQIAINKAMSFARINVEWIFKEVKTLWTPMDFPSKLRVLQISTGILYFVDLFVSNVGNCVYRKQTSAHFHCELPTLSEFLACRDWIKTYIRVPCRRGPPAPESVFSAGKLFRESAPRCSQAALRSFPSLLQLHGGHIEVGEH